jgi:hypothetical protein
MKLWQVLLWLAIGFLVAALVVSFYFIATGPRM